MSIKQRVAAVAAAVLLGGVLTPLALAPGASAHGALQKPGSRTYLCWLDGLTGNGALQPKNPACAAAIASSGPTPLYNWFAVLRSDAAGRTTGFIPDGKLCSAAATVYDFSGFDLARTDWPVTHLTAGGTFNFEYSNWAHHPGTFYLYVTKDGWSPTQPLAWSDLEDQPFLTVTNPAQTGSVGTDDGHYYWSGRLPSGKSGRHIIYSRWVRSDSNENFFGCSDVVFDGGNGQVTGLGGSSTGTTTATTTSTRTSTSTTTSTRTSTSTTTTTTGGGGGTNGTCSASVRTVSSWSGGFQGEVTVRNNGSSALSGWTVTITLPSGVTITQLWNGTWTAGSSTVRNVSWNSSIPGGGTTAFGFLGGGSLSGTPTATCTSP
ncbi:MAG: chitin-binding protein [Actinomycetales bacterium]|nr:chitin-binding protein [Actinomycetales bacterium]